MLMWGTGTSPRNTSLEHTHPDILHPIYTAGAVNTVEDWRDTWDHEDTAIPSDGSTTAEYGDGYEGTPTPPCEEQKVLGRDESNEEDIMSDLSEGEGGMMIMNGDKVDSDNEMTIQRGEDDDDQDDKGGGMKDENNTVRDCVV